MQRVQQWFSSAPHLPEPQPGTGIQTTDSPVGRTDPHMLTTFNRLPSDMVLQVLLMGLMALLLMVAIIGWIFALACAVAAALQPALAAGREDPVVALAGGSTQRRPRLRPILLIGPDVMAIGIIGSATGPELLHTLPDLSAEDHARAAAALQEGTGVLGVPTPDQTLTFSDGQTLETVTVPSDPEFGLLITPETATALGITTTYVVSALIPAEPMPDLLKAWLAVSNGGLDRTLWSVGAQPGLLRHFTAAQGTMIATAGMLLGLTAGLLTAIATAIDSGSGPAIATHWLNTPLLVLAIGLPATGWLTGTLFGALINRRAGSAPSQSHSQLLRRNHQNMITTTRMMKPKTM